MNAMFLTAAVSSAVAGFRADFPSASVIESPSGGRLTNASGFEARALGPSPEAAARAFLARYGAAFGISARQRLTLGDAVPSGQVGRVRFERQMDGLPVFDGDVVVGVDAMNSVILVNSSDVPAETSGHFGLSRRAAIRAAMKGLPGVITSDSPRVARGWKAIGSVIHPVWRVDFTAERPPGDWRSYVDAETGKVVLRTDLRSSADGSGVRADPGTVDKVAPKH